VVNIQKLRVDAAEGATAELIQELAVNFENEEE
jgi:hypothetical protein